MQYMAQASPPLPASPAREDTADKPQLTYAPAPSQRGRRVRRAILAILLLGAITIAIIWHAPFWSHAQVLWWQHACASFSLPADTVVASTGTGASATSGIKMPACWLHYESLAATPVAGRGRLQQTIAFLHRRQSPARHQRIVALRCVPIYLASASILQSLQPMVVEPADFWRLQSLPRFAPGPAHGGYPVFMPINLFAGQIDPNDDAHFTLAYTINGKPGRVDGWLNDDDTVKLEVHAGSPSLLSELHHPK
jgi:hypothetical protein